MLTKNTIKWLHSLQQLKFRQKYGLFLAEGDKIVNELINSKFAIHSLYATDPYILKIKNNALPQIEVITEAELKHISTLTTPNKALGVFNIPNYTIPPLAPSNYYLALDGIRDPGNMGTIIRTAAWFGIDTLFLSEDCVDVYNPKVVQSTMGSIAHVAMIPTNIESLIDQFHGPIYSTSLQGEDLNEIIMQPGIIIMGNEANGVKKEIMNKCNKLIKIPGFGKAESLNVAVATGIICHKIKCLIK